MVKVLLFDFWGTLVEQGVHSPIKQVKTILNIDLPFPEYVVRMERAMMTRKFVDLREAFTSVCTEFNLSCSEEKIEELVGMWNKSWMLAHPYLEVEKVLAQLEQKYTLVLVSNTDNFSVQNVLEKYPLRHHFKHLFLSFETGLLKTDQGFFSHLLNELGVDVDDCVMIGDSIQSDILPAKRMGINAILVDRRGSRDSEQSVRTLDEVEGLLHD